MRTEADSSDFFQKLEDARAMGIEATFTGKDSLGYQNGTRYKLLLTEKAGKLIIKRVDLSGQCPYDSLKAFLDNWTDVRKYNVITEQT